MKNVEPNISKELRNELVNYIEGLENIYNSRSKTKLKEAKVNAINSLLTISRKHYLDCDDMELVKDEMLVSKKFSHIKEADTVKDISLIMSFPSINSYGGEIIQFNKWVLPEEELMIWSKTSLIGPLNSIGMKRYVKLFRELFPVEYSQINNYIDLNG